MVIGWLCSSYFLQSGLRPLTESTLWSRREEERVSTQFTQDISFNVLEHCRVSLEWFFVQEDCKPPIKQRSLCGLNYWDVGRISIVGFSVGKIAIAQSSWVNSPVIWNKMIWAAKNHARKNHAFAYIALICTSCVLIPCLSVERVLIYRMLIWKRNWFDEVMNKIIFDASVCECEWVI